MRSEEVRLERLQRLLAPRFFYRSSGFESWCAKQENKQIGRAGLA
jgi:hypothetical protein